MACVDAVATSGLGDTGFCTGGDAAATTGGGGLELSKRIEAPTSTPTDLRTYVCRCMSFL